MNAFFHLFAALASTLLIWQLLRVQAQRDFLRLLATSLSPVPSQKLQVESPLNFLSRFAAALRIPCDEGLAIGSAQPPVRIVTAPLMELWVRAGISLIRCPEASLAAGATRTQLEFVTARDLETEARKTLAATIKAALGGGIAVSISNPPTPKE